jgi:cytochrome c biogenesis protein CcdA
MLFFILSVLAGVLTILAPCILPLLPIVIGTADGAGRGIPRRSLVVIGSLAVSAFVFTLLLKASTLLIEIPPYVWTYFSGSVIVLVGLALLFPDRWSKLPFLARLSRGSNQLVGAGYQKQNTAGDVTIGLALGPVFTTCSPTYFFIIATVLPASLLAGLVYLLGFIFGLVVALLLVAYFGQQLTSYLTTRMGTATYVKQLFAGLIILVGIAIITGYDKKFEAWVLDSGYGATIQFEEGLIDRFNPLGTRVTNGPGGIEGARASLAPPADDTVPAHLLQAFPITDWSKVDPALAAALPGGPGRDGIPAIDDPVFVPIGTFTHGAEVPAIWLRDGETIKVYPYNILNWHEIVNDTVAEVPVAITFCPLCGSAVVFDRRVGGETLTFGVSGSLLESNMIMFDRESETLWQQSTGEGLAGTYFGSRLDLVSFQLGTVGEIAAAHPDAVIVSEDTGYRRDYARNPYAGYTETDTFIFSPSQLDVRYHPKEIFAIFRAGETPVGMPWAELVDGRTYETTVSEVTYTVTRAGNELTITNEAGVTVPFYFEMWFSFAVQHGETGEVFDPV